MNFTLECEREDDGRWLAEVLELPGALAYGSSANEAMARAEILALRVLAERLEHGEVNATRLGSNGWAGSNRTGLQTPERSNISSCK